MLSALQLELKAGSSKVVGIITLKLELKAGSSKVVGIISAAA